MTTLSPDYASASEAATGESPDVWRRRSKLIGIAGTAIFGTVMLKAPGFPTPDKFLLLATFVAMTFGQATALLKRFVPFVGLLIAYESFRGLAPHLNHSVNFTWMPGVDRAMFGELPTTALQRHLWRGQVQWYDVTLYVVYLFHFIMPLALGVLVWKKRDSYYWQYVSSFIALSFAGFLTYLLFPAAPPWMAAQHHVIEPVVRVQAEVWQSLGIRDVSLIYDKISPNTVAAVPSLHSAYAVLSVLVIHRLWGYRWSVPAATYPVLIWFGTVYQGEHYVIDALLGVVYAVVVFAVVTRLFERRRERRAALPTLSVPSGV